MRSKFLEYNLAFSKRSINNSHFYCNCSCREERETPIFSASPAPTTRAKTLSCLSPIPQHPEDNEAMPELSACTWRLASIISFRIWYKEGAENNKIRPWLLQVFTLVLEGSLSLISCCCQIHLKFTKLREKPRGEHLPTAENSNPTTAPGQHSWVQSNGFHGNMVPGSKTT